VANRGETKGQKSLSVATLRKLKRKANVWTVRSLTGAHSKETSVPIAYILRDVLAVAEKLKEAKRILNEGHVKVNGKVVKDYRFPVGMFDVIDLEKSAKRYRFVLDSKGKIDLKEISAKETVAKIIKITGKRIVKKGLIQLEASDGRTFLEKKTSVKVGDSVLVEFPVKKISKHLDMKEGNLAYVISGKHAGTTGKIKLIVEGGLNKDKLLTLEGSKGDFQTAEKNVLVIGDKKALIDV